MTHRMSAGKTNSGITRAHWGRQDLLILGYNPSHFEGLELQIQLRFLLGGRRVNGFQVGRHGLYVLVGHIAQGIPDQVNHDQQAREAVQQRFTETARGWQTASERQVDVQTLADVLCYMRVHVNVVLLDALRASTQPGEMPWPQASSGEEPGAAGRHESGEVWDMLRSSLPDPREQRLASLLFHCGLLTQEDCPCLPRG